MRHSGNKICRDKQTDAQTNVMNGNPENIMPMPTLSGREGIKICIELKVVHKQNKRLVCLGSRQYIKEENVTLAEVRFYVPPDTK